MKVPSGVRLLQSRYVHFGSMKGTITLVLLESHDHSRCRPGQSLYPPRWGLQTQQTFNLYQLHHNKGAFDKPNFLGFRAGWDQQRGGYIPDAYLAYFFIRIPYWAILLTAMLWKFWTLLRRIKRRKNSATGRFEVILNTNPQPTHQSPPESRRFP